MTAQDLDPNELLERSRQRPKPRRRSVLSSIPGHLEGLIILKWLKGLSPARIVAWLERTNGKRKIKVETSRSAVVRLLRRAAESDTYLSQLAVIRRARCEAHLHFDELLKIGETYEALMKEAQEHGAEKETRARQATQLKVLAQRERYLHRVLKLADVSGKNVGQLESFMREPEQHGAEDHETRRLLTRQEAIERLREAEGPDAIPVLARPSREEALQQAGELSWEELLREEAALKAFEERLPDDARTFAEELGLEPPEPGDDAPEVARKNVRVDSTISSGTSQIEVDTPPVTPVAAGTPAPPPPSHPAPAPAQLLRTESGAGTLAPQNQAASEKSVRVDPTAPGETGQIQVNTPPVTLPARPPVPPLNLMPDRPDTLEYLAERRRIRAADAAARSDGPALPQRAK